MSTLPSGGSNGSNNGNSSSPRLPWPLLARTIRLLAVINVDDGVVAEVSNDLCRLLSYSSVHDVIGHPFVDLVHHEDRLVVINSIHRLCSRDPDQSLPSSPLNHYGPPIRNSNGTGNGMGDSPSPRLPDENDCVDATQELFEVRCMCRDGAYRWMWWEAAIVKDSNSRRWIIATARDVTQMHREMRRLRVAKEQAELSDSGKSDFLASCSHEIRTPLNGIKGMAALLTSTPLTAEQTDHLNNIQASSDHLLHIVNDLLDFSKIGAGKMELERRPLHVESTVEEAIELAYRPAKDGHLEVVYLVESNVPQYVDGDVTRLRQIITNLLGNALKFTPKGEVFIHVSLPEVDRRAKDDTKTTSEGKTVPSTSSMERKRRPSTSDDTAIDELADPYSILQFAVRDTGLGIPVEAQSRLFRAFHQADSSTVRTHGGTGLGLAISHRLAELMGGSMWVESTPGQGSTFFFTIRAPAVSLSAVIAANSRDDGSSVIAIPRTAFGSAPGSSNTSPTPAPHAPIPPAAISVATATAPSATTVPPIVPPKINGHSTTKTANTNNKNSTAASAALVAAATNMTVPVLTMHNSLSPPMTPSVGVSSPRHGGFSRNVSPSLPQGGQALMLRRDTNSPRTSPTRSHSSNSMTGTSHGDSPPLFSTTIATGTRVSPVPPPGMSASPVGPPHMSNNNNTGMGIPSGTAAAAVAAANAVVAAAATSSSSTSSSSSSSLSSSPISGNGASSSNNNNGIPYDAPFVGMRALIVDDNATTLRAIAVATHRWGMIPSTINSADTALSWIRDSNRKFDVVIIDSRLGDVNGVQLAADMRAEMAQRPRRGSAAAKIAAAESSKLLPIILLTQPTSNNDEDSAMRDAKGRPRPELFQGHVRKPVKFSRLFTVLTNALSASPGTSSPVQSKRRLEKFDSQLSSRFPLSIMVAEDNLINMKLATHVLKRLGYKTVQQCMDGVEAVNATQIQDFDLIFMDMQMPNMDGTDATRAIRRAYQIRALEGRPHRREIGPVIIAMTANAMAKDREKCFEAGMDDYISKPIELSIIGQKIAHWAVKLASESSSTKSSSPSTAVAMNNLIAPSLTSQNNTNSSNSSNSSTTSNNSNNSTHNSNSSSSSRGSSNQTSPNHTLSSSASAPSVAPSSALDGPLTRMPVRLMTRSSAAPSSLTHTPSARSGSPLVMSSASPTPGSPHEDSGMERSSSSSSLSSHGFTSAIGGNTRVMGHSRSNALLPLKDTPQLDKLPSPSLTSVNGNGSNGEKPQKRAIRDIIDETRRRSGSPVNGSSSRSMGSPSARATPILAPLERPGSSSSSRALGISSSSAGDDNGRPSSRLSRRSSSGIEWSSRALLHNNSGNGSGNNSAGESPGSSEPNSPLPLSPTALAHSSSNGRPTSPSTIGGISSSSSSTSSSGSTRQPIRMFDKQRNAATSSSGRNAAAAAVAAAMGDNLLTPLGAPLSNNSLSGMGGPLPSPLRMPRGLESPGGASPLMPSRRLPIAARSRVLENRMNVSNTATPPESPLTDDIVEPPSP